MDAYQYAKPAGFPDPLPDSVTLAGKTFTGTRAKVYWLLEITRQRNYQHRIGQQLGPPGWVPRFLVVEPWSGGGQGDRRLRELRQEYDCAIEDRAFEGGGTTLYRLREPGAVAETSRHTSPHEASKGSPIQRLSDHAHREIGSGPLAGLRFWTHVGSSPQEPPTGSGGSGAAPGGCNSPITSPQPSGRHSSAVLQVDPGADCAIAPSLRILGRIAKGERDTVQLDESYLDELRAAREVGDLLPVFASLDAAVLSIQTASPWNPLPTLTYALTRLGAQHAGDLSKESA